MQWSRGGYAWKELLLNPSCAGEAPVGGSGGRLPVRGAAQGSRRLVGLVSCPSHFQAVLHGYEWCKLKHKAKKVVQARMHEFGPRTSALNDAGSQTWESSRFFVDIVYSSFNTKGLSRDQILTTLSATTICNCFILNLRDKQSLNLWVTELRGLWEHFSNETSNMPTAPFQCSQANSDIKWNRHVFRYLN